MKKLVIQTILGTDTSLGILVYIALSLAFERPVTLLWAGVAVFLAHAPDLDFIQFLLLRKSRGWYSHWPVEKSWPWWQSYHRPIPYLAVVLALGYGIAQIVGTDTSFVLALIASLSVLHFLHDAAEGIQGFAFFVPFTSADTRWKLTLRGFERVSPFVFRSHYQRVKESMIAGRKSGNDLTAWQVSINAWELSLFILSNAALVYFCR